MRIGEIFKRTAARLWRAAFMLLSLPAMLPAISILELQRS
jgi:hypothetical protein